MDVTNTEFIPALPSILKHISSSHFIAFDLELSGIPIHKHRTAAGKQTLQERYSEFKKAAEKYQILQLGITCVEQNSELKTYELRSYNFNLSPLINEDVGLDRDFTYSTGAVEFLLSHGYEMDKPFRSGIPYLTRSETALAEERARSRLDRTALPDIKLAANDQKAHQFLDNARDQINSWQRPLSTNSASSGESLLIGGIPMSTQEQIQPSLPLNAFERRLVHQLVRSEFPSLSTQSRGDYVKVYAKDLRDQAAHKKLLQQRLNDLLFRQTGLRWVTEALVGGDLSGLFPAILGYKPKTTIKTNNDHTEGYERTLRETLTAVNERRKVLVGHNCFIDLVYFYHTFIDTLPEDVTEFQNVIRKIFPLVIDTKYLATAGPGGYAFRNSQLSQIDSSFAHMKSPAIDAPKDHPSYLNAEQYHEAGYDSYVTSKVLLRLVAKFLMENSQHSAIISDNPVPIADSIIPKPLPAQEPAPEPWVTSKAPVTSKSSIPSSHTSKPPSSNRFASLADNLGNEDDEMNNGPDTAEKPSPSNSDNKPPPTSLIRRSNSDKPEVPSSQAKTSDLNRILIPAWDDEFWTTYGNKLRVYGTVEESLDLNPTTDKDDRSLALENRPSLLTLLIEKLKSFIL